jgi:hypothetical protein
MAIADSTMSPPNACPKYTSSVDPNREEGAWVISPLEKALEEERERLMLANSMLGCIQIALDPEAITVTPVVYYPEVLDLARQFINRSVSRLEYKEIRRLVHKQTGDGI